MVRVNLGALAPDFVLVEQLASLRLACVSLVEGGGALSLCSPPCAAVVATWLPAAMHFDA